MPAWSDCFSCDAEMFAGAVSRLRDAERDRESALVAISLVGQREGRALRTPTDRWREEQVLRDAYEAACKSVAAAQVELLTLVSTFFRAEGLPLAASAALPFPAATTETEARHGK